MNKGDQFFDVAVIGAGQAAMPLIFELAEVGKSVVLIERKNLGGSCVNFGCTPSKAVIASARVAQLARRAGQFGLVIPSVGVDLAEVLNGARAVVMESRTGLEDEFKNIDNPSLLRGHARLEGRTEKGFRIRVGADQTIIAGQVVLDTGTRASIPEIEGLDKISYLTAGNWIDQSTLPKHLVFLGAGVIGLEMAQFYRRMGSTVTVVNDGSRLLPHEDEDVATALQKLLEAEGITFHFCEKMLAVAPTPAGGVTATVSTGDQTTQIEGTDLFVAVGRKPNTDDLGLDTVGVELLDDGIVKVDKTLVSSVEGIWVVGDIRGGPAFTHTSWDDYRILKSQMIGDKSRTTDRLVPYAIFTDPQLGRVGITETEARKSGKKVKLGRFEMLHNGRAREYREREGFIKVIVDAETDRLIGATVLSDEAAELVQIYSTLMVANAPYTVIRDSIFIHPTYGEAVQSATEAVE